ncbi:MAG: NUDIX domain-containing protein [Prolixibacteraceae bacterium]
MALYDQLLSDDQLHRKSRIQKHALYPYRFWVPDSKVFWEVNYPEYFPPEFNAPVVLDEKTPWADPQDIALVTHPFNSFLGEVQFNQKGIPLNKIGRTGISGRGVLGKWGANFAVDAIITTVDPENNFLILTIKRKDTGEIAFPGGMVDPGEDVFTTRNREAEEELSVKETDLANPLYEKIVSRGYIDDPRNTDNAWLETTAIHTHLAYEVANNMALKAGDDAIDFSWIKISNESLRRFYANHGLMLMKALMAMVQSHPTFLSRVLMEKVKSILQE